MFLVRSAFWLTVAFLVIGPKDVDLGRAAGDLSSQAMAAGQQMIAQKVLETECSTLECMGGKAVIAAALPSSNPSADSSMQDSSQNPVPFPRPRPDRMG
jgi:hypothetical protein